MSLQRHIGMHNDDVDENFKTLNFIYFTTITHSSTNWPRGDLVGWRINTKHFRSGKTVGVDDD